VLRTKTTIRFTWWPTPQDYNEAVQALSQNTQDVQLQRGVLCTDAMGLPRPVSGAFASVYKVTTRDKQDHALRCFLRNIADQSERYSLISNYVQNDDLPYTVTFDFMQSGIRVNGSWFPALKMDWVAGKTLDAYIGTHAHDRSRMSELTEKFLQMCSDLAAAGVAHGDLQHGNIIVTETDELRLVDYDGMFVPSMKGMASNELGHRNYQHPGRAAEHFGEYLDNFSAWVIYTSLRAITLDPTLYALLHGGDDCLLFRRNDFLDPVFANAFAILERHREKEVRMLARFVRSQLSVNPRDVPPLSADVPEVKELVPLAGGLAKVAAQAQINPGSALPAWMQESKAQRRVQSAGDTQVGSVVSNNTAAPKSQDKWVSAVEPEFSNQQQSPRRVFWRGPLQTSPVFWQVVALFSPMLWLMGYLIVGWADGNFNSSYVGVFIALALMTIAIEVLIWAKPLQCKWLVSRGQAAIGVVKHVGKFYSGGGEVIIEFQTGDGRSYTVVHQVSSEQCDMVAVGELCTIVYNKNSPLQDNAIYKFSPYQLTPPLPYAQVLKMRLAAALRKPAAVMSSVLPKAWRLVQAAKPHNVPNPVAVPEWALNQAAPRRTKFDERNGLLDTSGWQVLMLINPLLWAAIWLWCTVLQGRFDNLPAAILFALINCFLQFMIWFEGGRNKRLAKYGTAVGGVITRRLTDYTNSNLVEYGFRTADGRVFKRTMAVRSERAYKALNDHQAVTVLYYDGPFGTESVIYILSSYKAI
jgi:hypothetical protein